MADNFNTNQIQSTVGYYFKDEKLLISAFTHSSRAVYGDETNERLLFLGRRLFETIVCDYIFNRSPYSKEDQLEEQLDFYLSGKLCESYLRNHKLDKYIRLSELSDVLQDNQKVHREMFFALVGAIYRDGGMPSLKGFLLPLLRSSDGESAHYSDSAKPRKSYSEPEQKSEGKRYKPQNIEPVKKPEPSPKTEAPTPVEEKPRSFIRDALAPVRLPDSMKTQPKTNGKLTNRERKKLANMAITPEFDTTDGENYKSMLQELVQKNIRTPNVLLKYETSFTSDGMATTGVYLDGKLLASAETDNKRLSERAAAKNAYEALNNKDSEAFKLFREMSDSDIDIPERREDYISKLNQYFQRTEHESSAPITYERRYSTERKTFCVALFHKEEEIASAKGPTLKDARQNAAKLALEKLGVL